MKKKEKNTRENQKQRFFTFVFFFSPAFQVAFQPDSQYEPPAPRSLGRVPSVVVLRRRHGGPVRGP